MLQRNTRNGIGNNLTITYLVYNCLLFLISLLFLHCSSEKVSFQTSILSSLHPGIPWDSAKALTDEAGWVCDTPLTYSPETKSLLFSYVRIPNVDDTFEALLNFKSGKLEGFSLRDVSVIFSDPNAPSAHTLKKYNQFQTLLQSLYGHPSSSQTKVKPLIHSGNHVDTTFIMTWFNAPTKSVYTFQYDALIDGLSFVVF